MPYVHIQVTDEGVSKEQKAELIKGTTDLLVDVLNKEPSTTFVVIEEVPLENWGIAGVPVTEFRAKRTGS
ncbi:tautomerase [Alphaproteobacteria bacterium AO1-B]|nr:tautomerase [Alphaproteobacteria bacterium AO1-B]